MGGGKCWYKCPFICWELERAKGEDVDVDSEIGWDEKLTEHEEDVIERTKNGKIPKLSVCCARLEYCFDKIW